MYDATDIERVRELLAQGWSKAAIAKHLRISRRVIYNWADAGYFAAPTREPRVRARSRVDRIQEASSDGESRDKQTQRVG